MVEPDGAWRRGRPIAISWLASTPQGQCGETGALRCFDAQHFVKGVLLDSDTDMAVRSFVPELRRRAEGDLVGRLRASYRDDPRPSFATYGPRDGAEWRRFRAVHGAGPG